MLSDHNVLHMNINIQKPPWPVKYITHRNIKKVNIKEIKKDTFKLNEKMADISNINKLVSIYNDGLLKVMDKHAPKKKIKITVRKKTSWFSEENKTIKLKGINIMHY